MGLCYGNAICIARHGWIFSNSIICLGAFNIAMTFYIAGPVDMVANKNSTKGSYYWNVICIARHVDKVAIELLLCGALRIAKQFFARPVDMVGKYIFCVGCLLF